MSAFESAMLNLFSKYPTPELVLTSRALRAALAQRRAETTARIEK